MVRVVSFSIFSYFYFPEIRYLAFPFRKSIPMPKISIYKNNNSCSTKNNIRLAGKTFYMFSESQSFPVER